MKIQSFNLVDSNIPVSKNSQEKTQATSFVKESYLKEDTVSFGVSIQEKLLKLKDAAKNSKRIKAALEQKIKMGENLSPEEVKLLKEVTKICKSLPGI